MKFYTVKHTIILLLIMCLCFKVSRMHIIKLTLLCSVQCMWSFFWVVAFEFWRPFFIDPFFTRPQMSNDTGESKQSSLFSRGLWTHSVVCSQCWWKTQDKKIIERKVKKCHIQIAHIVLQEIVKSLNENVFRPQSATKWWCKSFCS